MTPQQAATPVPELTEDDQRVSVSPEAITQSYQQALADETQRRILAEAMVQALVAERAELRRQIPTDTQPTQEAP